MQSSTRKFNPAGKEKSKLSLEATVTKVFTEFIFIQSKTSLGVCNKIWDGKKIIIPFWRFLNFSLLFQVWGVTFFQRCIKGETSSIAKAQLLPEHLKCYKHHCRKVLWSPGLACWVTAGTFVHFTDDKGFFYCPLDDLQALTCQVVSKPLRNSRLLCCHWSPCQNKHNKMKRQTYLIPVKFVTPSFPQINLTVFPLIQVSDKVDSVSAKDNKPYKLRLLTLTDAMSSTITCKLWGKLANSEPGENIKCRFSCLEVTNSRNNEPQLSSTDLMKIPQIDSDEPTRKLEVEVVGMSEE